MIDFGMSSKFTQVREALFDLLSESRHLPPENHMFGDFVTFERDPESNTDTGSDKIDTSVSQQCSPQRVQKWLNWFHTTGADNVIAVYRRHHPTWRLFRHCNLMPAQVRTDLCEFASKAAERGLQALEKDTGLMDEQVAEIMFVFADRLDVFTAGSALGAAFLRNMRVTKYEQTQLALVVRHLIQPDPEKRATAETAARLFKDHTQDPTAKRMWRNLGKRTRDWPCSTA